MPKARTVARRFGTNRSHMATLSAQAAASVLASQAALHSAVVAYAESVETWQAFQEAEEGALYDSKETASNRRTIAQENLKKVLALLASLNQSSAAFLS